MTDKPRDERFSAPPPLPAADPASYPKGLKPGDPGFIEALAKEGGFTVTYKKAE